MQLKESGIVIEKSETSGTTSFGISKGNEAHLLGILRNKLYTDKMYAVIREYATNGTDAHEENGCPEKPIDVYVPNAISPTFIVRDYGKGLSEEKIRNHYTQYGDSSKRGDNKQIGGLGIGCKAAFSYTDMFTVTSITQEGDKRIKRTYSAYIDETRVGAIDKTSEKETEEETGIEIKVPVKANDVIPFANKCISVFRFFRVKPNLKNVDKNLIPVEKVFLEGDNWYIATELDATRQQEPTAIMGDIGYPINEDIVLTQGFPGQRFYYWSTNAKENDIDKVGMILRLKTRIKFEIGELDIAANREGLEYDTQTIEAIKKRCIGIYDQLSTIISKRLEACKSLIEAKLLWNKIISCLSISNLNGIWNGHRVDSTNILVKFPKGIKGDYLAHGRRGPTFKKLYDIDLTTEKYADKEAYIDIGTLETYDIDKLLFVEKRKDTSYWMKRVLYKKTKGNYGNIIIFEVLTPGTREAFIKDNGIPEDLIINCDDIEIPKTEVADTIKVNNKKHQTKCFELDIEAAKKFHSGTKSDVWKPAEIDKENGEGIFLELDKFFWKVDGVMYNPTVISDYLSTLKEIGNEIDKIYGVKTAEANTMGPNWRRLEDVAKEKLTEYINKEDALKRMRGGEAYRSYWNRNYEVIYKHMEDFADPNSPMLDFVKKLHDLKKDKDCDNQFKHIIFLLRKIKGELKEPEDIDFRLKISKVVERYPLLDEISILTHAGGYYYSSILVNKPHLVASVIDYINLIDKRV